MIQRFGENIPRENWPGNFEGNRNPGWIGALGVKSSGRGKRGRSAERFQADPAVRYYSLRKRWLARGRTGNVSISRGNVTRFIAVAESPWLRLSAKILRILSPPALRGLAFPAKYQHCRGGYASATTGREPGRKRFSRL